MLDGTAWALSPTRSPLQNGLLLNIFLSFGDISHFRNCRWFCVKPPRVWKLTPDTFFFSGGGTVTGNHHNNKKATHRRTPFNEFPPSLPEFVRVLLRGSSNFLGGWKRALKSKRPGRLRRFWPLERIKFRRGLVGEEGGGGWVVGWGRKWEGTLFFFSRWKLERAQLRKKYMSNQIWVFYFGCERTFIVVGMVFWKRMFFHQSWSFKVDPNNLC